MTRPILVLVAVMHGAACYPGNWSAAGFPHAEERKPPKLAAVTVGAVHPMTDDTSNGVALRIGGGREVIGPDLSFRRTDDTMELAIGITLFGAREMLWDRAGVFA